MLAKTSLGHLHFSQSALENAVQLTDDLYVQNLILLPFDETHVPGAGFTATRGHLVMTVLPHLSLS